MKNNFKFLFAFAILSLGVANAQVGINTTSPNASAALDITSTDKGLLIPRMTTAQRTAIATPVEGLSVYDTTTKSNWQYNGTAWTNASPDMRSVNSGSHITNDAGVGGTGINAGGTNVIAIGSGAGFANSGSNATFIGPYAGYANTASNTIAIGTNSLRVNTTGSPNIGIGVQSLFKNTTGNSNVAIGPYSQQTNVTGNNNVSMGLQSLSFNTGSNNVAMGSYSMYGVADLSTGSSNLAAGPYSLYRYTSGSSNVGLGNLSLQNNSEGSNNVAIGVSSGSVITTGANNTFIGYGADATSASLNNINNSTAIGYLAKAGASNSIVLGGTGAAASNVVIGATVPTAVLDVRGATLPDGVPSFLIGDNEQATTLTTLPNAFGMSITNNWALGQGDNTFINRFANSATISSGFRFVQQTGTGTFKDLVYMNGQTGNVSIGTTNANANLNLNGYIRLGSSDATADVAPTAGLIRYNSTTDKFEGYVNDADSVTAGNQPGWVSLN